MKTLIIHKEVDFGWEEREIEAHIKQQCNLPVVSGSVNDRLDDMIDAWHNGDSKLPLYEYLKMTKEEYELWLKNPDVVEKHSNTA